MIESLVQPHDHHACDCLACAIPLRNALLDTDNQRLTPLSLALRGHQGVRSVCKDLGGPNRSLAYAKSIGVTVDLTVHFR
jgi:hypothetical protein